MTDGGSHHVDIAQWGINQVGNGAGPTKIEPLMAEHPVRYRDGFPTLDNQYNCATRFHVKVTFPNDIIMHVRDSCHELGFGNGIMFAGTKGRFFVNRAKITGKPVEELKDNPLPEDVLKKIYHGKQPGGPNAHMRNFFECLVTRAQPISDVFAHHRALTTCHLANTAIRLNRGLRWDPQVERGDDTVNS